MEKQFTVPLSEEQINYLQRLGVEVDSKAFLIDYMFNNHMNDGNLQMFKSAPFQHYEKQYEEAFAAFNLAKAELENSCLKPIVYEKYGDGTEFTWTIDDYASLECKITVL